jgi:hypothetical protein
VSSKLPPDGEGIVFSLGGTEPGIYTARLDGSDVEQLTASPTGDHHANWRCRVGLIGEPQ